MGGPNFPTVKNEQEEFLKNEPWMRFLHISKRQNILYQNLSNLH